MKTCYISLSGLLLFTATSISYASPISFGVGVGALYNGLGVNAAFNYQEGLLPYVSVGCIGAATSGNETRYNCGFGAGIINAKWLSPRRLNHGLGFAAGITKDETEQYKGDLDSSEPYTDLTETYIGVGYTWFSNSINRPGFTVGATPMVIKNKIDHQFHLQLNLGYQF